MADKAPDNGIPESIWDRARCVAVLTLRAIVVGLRRYSGLATTTE
jgi:hypothetical protein